MQRRFGELVERLASAGTDTTTAVETHLRALMDGVDRRQRETNAAMIELLGQIRASVTENQRESAAKLADSVAAIGTSVDALLRDLATQREAMGAAGRQSLDELKTGLAALVSNNCATPRARPVNGTAGTAAPVRRGRAASSNSVSKS